MDHTPRPRSSGGIDGQDWPQVHMQVGIFHGEKSGAKMAESF
jgi:hypothetical protein